MVCHTSKGSLYKQIKPPSVDEHAFPLTGFVYGSAHVTFGGSVVIMPAVRLELPNPCNTQVRSRDATSRRGSYVKMHSHKYNTMVLRSRCNDKYADYKLGSL